LVLTNYQQIAIAKAAEFIALVSLPS
jgi:hypothetical protein